MISRYACGLDIGNGAFGSHLGSGNSNDWLPNLDFQFRPLGRYAFRPPLFLHRIPYPAADLASLIN